MSQELINAIQKAQSDPRLPAAIAAIYANLQQQTDILKPRCTASGRCCNFDAYGHRLYVTTIELAVFASQLERPTPINRDTAPTGPKPASTLPLPQITNTPPAGQCTYQVDGRCTVHPIRPFGCRIFFCDESAEQWQQDQYEQTHTQIKALHEEMNIPYFYVEWRAALQAMNESLLIL